METIIPLPDLYAFIPFATSPLTCSTGIDGSWDTQCSGRRPVL